MLLVQAVLLQKDVQAMLDLHSYSSFSNKQQLGKVLSPLTTYYF
jgi:hypothetical protein